MNLDKGCYFWFALVCVTAIVCTITAWVVPLPGGSYIFESLWAIGVTFTTVIVFAVLEHWLHKISAILRRRRSRQYLMAGADMKPLNAEGSHKVKMLEDRLNDFLSKNDWSKPAAGVLEGDLDDYAEGEHATLVGDLQHALAMYAPGGGEFLYDKAALDTLIRRALSELGGAGR